MIVMAWLRLSQQKGRQPHDKCFYDFLLNRTQPIGPN